MSIPCGETREIVKFSGHRLHRLHRFMELPRAVLLVQAGRNDPGLSVPTVLHSLKSIPQPERGSHPHGRGSEA